MTKFSRWWRYVVLLAVVSPGAAAARGQIAAYGAFTANDLTQTSTFVTGGTFGVYDDFFKLLPLRLGVDVRGSKLASGQTSLSTVMGGLRFAVKPPLLPIKPYVQADGGVAKLGTGSASVNPGYKLAYDVSGGVDVTFLPHLDWRAVEVGAGAINGIPDSQFHVSTGLVFRFF